MPVFHDHRAIHHDEFEAAGEPPGVVIRRTVVNRSWIKDDNVTRAARTQYPAVGQAKSACRCTSHLCDRLLHRECLAVPNVLGYDPWKCAEAPGVRLSGSAVRSERVAIRANDSEFVAY